MASNSPKSQNVPKQKCTLTLTAALFFVTLGIVCVARLGVIPVFLLALTITLVLVFFPRSPETPPAFKEIEVSHSLFANQCTNVMIDLCEELCNIDLTYSE